MKLTLELRPQQKQRVDILHELTDPEKDQVMKAIEFWESKPHDKLTISLNQLKMFFGQKPAGKEPGLEEADFLEEEFVMLDPKEMDKVDPDEKVGSRTHDIIFIAKNTPKEYVPMVVLNLIIGRKVSAKDEEIMELFRSQNIDVDNVDMSRHWSANLFDIMIAEKQFPPTQFRQYLEWRKKIERTDFFKNPDMHEFMERMLNYKKYKKITHPSKRQKYSRQSWSLSGGMLSWGNEFVDRCGKDMRVSRADVLFRRLAEMEEYNPETMMRTLTFIMNNAEKVKEKGGRTSNQIDFGGHQMLSGQAYLLTEEVIGRNFSLLKSTGEGDEYKLANSHKMTIKALKDRISYFYREAIKKLDEHNHVTSELVSAIRNRVDLMVQNEGGKVIPINVNSPTVQEDIVGQEDAIREKLKAIEQMLGDYVALEERIKEKAKTSSPTIIPGSIEEDKSELIEAQEQLQAQLKDLEETKGIVIDLDDLRRRRKELLSNVEMGEPVSLAVN